MKYKMDYIHQPGIDLIDPSKMIDINEFLRERLI